MAIYLEWEGIEGNVTADGYDKHLSVDSFQFGVARGITMEAGNCSNREASRPSFSEVHVTKPADNSCTAIFTEGAYGSAGKTIKVKFVQTGSDKVTEYMTYTLENCLVSSYSVSADSEGDPIEAISISYTAIEVNYADYDMTNKQASPQRVGYDLAKAAKK
ncbi:Hcp family type VI secretion system effector [Teredinibacter haidensis]|uniref:Hcp family type VI secretion system effector n=1 Tax=Teredinibacter haidensis TaxID=2731755 RepID=UPI0009489E47|nr:type VI secretion system tube protein Hcp [Teredinibacter haidensis]